MEIVNECVPESKTHFTHGLREGVLPKRLDWPLCDSQNCPSCKLETRAIPFWISAVEESDYLETTTETLYQFQANNVCSDAEVDVCALLEQDKPQEHR